MDDNNRVPLKEHFDERLAAMEKQAELLRQMMEVRLDGMNRIREQMREQAASGISRKEVETRLDRIESDLRRLSEHDARNEGKASQTSVWVNLLIALAGIAIAIAALLK